MGKHSIEHYKEVIVNVCVTHVEEGQHLKIVGS
jgi:hypothetical protein